MRSAVVVVVAVDLDDTDRFHTERTKPQQVCEHKSRSMTRSYWKIYVEHTGWEKEPTSRLRVRIYTGLSPQFREMRHEGMEPPGQTNWLQDEKLHGGSILTEDIYVYGNCPSG